MDCMNKKNPPQVVGMTYVPWQHWGEVYEPVSYTHLDVYKRQVWGRTAFV